MTDEASNSSSPPASDASSSDVGQFKAIIAIGIMGDREDVARFAALWIADSERRAHRINEVAFFSKLTLLPLPEADIEIQE